MSLTAELQAERPAALNEPGVVVLLIKLGCTLDQDTIRAAVTALDAELISDANSSGWSDVEGRKAVVRHEILLLEAALKSGNKLPGDPIGARGITTGGTRPDAHLRHTRECQRDSCSFQRQRGIRPRPQGAESWRPLLAARCVGG